MFGQQIHGGVVTAPNDFEAHASFDEIDAKDLAKRLRQLVEVKDRKYG